MAFTFTLIIKYHLHDLNIWISVGKLLHVATESRILQILAGTDGRLTLMYLYLGLLDFYSQKVCKSRCFDYLEGCNLFMALMIRFTAVYIASVEDFIRGKG